MRAGIQPFFGIIKLGRKNHQHPSMTFSRAKLFIAFSCSSLPIAVAGSLWGVTPEQVGERYDPPPSENPKFDLPLGSRNLAIGRSVTTNFPEPLFGRLEMITDGSKGVATYPDGRIRYVDADNCYVEFSPSVPGVTGRDVHGLGPRYIQFDLQESVVIDAVWIWPGYRDHGYDVVRKLVVEISDDPNFKADTKTVFNCDTDNSMGFGVGQDRPFATSRYGKVIQISQIAGRFARIWCNGSVMSPWETRLVEIEIYGRPIALVRRQEALRLHDSDQRRNRRYIKGLSGLVVACTALIILVRHVRKKSKRIEFPPEE